MRKVTVAVGRLLFVCLLCALWGVAAVGAAGEAVNMTEIAAKAAQLVTLAKNIKLPQDGGNDDKKEEYEALEREMNGTVKLAVDVVNESRAAVAAYKTAGLSQSAHSAALLERAAGAARAHAAAAGEIAKRATAAPEAEKLLEKAKEAVEKAEKCIEELKGKVGEAEKITEDQLSAQATQKAEDLVKAAKEVYEKVKSAKDAADEAVAALRIQKLITAMTKAREFENEAGEVVNETAKVKSAADAVKNDQEKEKKDAFKDAVSKLKGLTEKLKTTANDTKVAQEAAINEVEGFLKEVPNATKTQTTKLLDEAKKVVQLANATQTMEAKEKLNIAAALEKARLDPAGKEGSQAAMNDGAFPMIAEFALICLLLHFLCVLPLRW